ncbi:MAG: hypothetical protein IGS54_24585 [Elainella sp. C42_A2020_010]|nr:hypothetical protein [Elainella sp. C42_A2020_010]
MRRILIHLWIILAVSTPPVIALPGHLEPALSPPLQTELTPQDLQRIEQLVAIAQRRSAEVRAARNARGWSAFADTAELEVSSYDSSDRSTSADGADSSASQGLSFVLTLYPVGIIAAIQQLPVLRLEQRQAQQQQRLEVIEHYINYVQAKQAVEIATYRMQQLPESGRHLDNPEYGSVATELLNANNRLYLAIEQLATSVGVTALELLALIE